MVGMVINLIIGAYIPIIRIPIKGGMTIPNIATFDHGTHVFLSWISRNGWHSGEDEMDKHQFTDLDPDFFANHPYCKESFSDLYIGNLHCAYLHRKNIALLAESYCRTSFPTSV